MMLFLFFCLQSIVESKPIDDPVQSLLDECKGIQENGECDMKCIGLDDEHDDEIYDCLGNKIVSKNITLATKVNIFGLSNEVQFRRWVKEIEALERKEHNQLVEMYFTFDEYMQQRNACLAAGKETCTIYAKTLVEETKCSRTADGCYTEGECSTEQYCCHNGKQVFSKSCNKPGYKIDNELKECRPQADVKACRNQDPWCKGKPDGIHGTVCADSYIHCIGQKDFHFNCPAWTKFSIKTKICGSSC